MSSTDEEYTVEKIIEKRYNRRTRGYEYLLKWVGYGHESNTWEPEEHLDCPKLFEEFNEEHKKKRQKTQSTSGLRNEPPNEIKQSPPGTSLLLPVIDVPFGQFSKASSLDKRAVVFSDASATKSPDVPTIISLDTPTIISPDTPTVISTDVPAIISPDTPAIVSPNGKIACAGTCDTLDSVLGELDNNHEPEKILGATKESGDISFLVKWKNTNEADLISHRVARIACPQSVIEYYEKNLIWNDDSENES